MATPLKGIVVQYDDAYNFYCSQLKITIERVFGVLVHRWEILRCPLTSLLSKLGPVIICMCRLHNFCINSKDEDALQSSKKDAAFVVRFIDSLRNHVDNCISNDATLLYLEHDRP